MEGAYANANAYADVNCWKFQGRVIYFEKKQSNSGVEIQQRLHIYAILTLFQTSQVVSHLQGIEARMHRFSFPFLLEFQFLPRCM